jgi:molybdopterin-guanine dinucleotide biosynthesis protein A
MAQRIGLVLAGGQGLRMGRPKGSLVLGGQSLATRAAHALRPLCGSVLISNAPGSQNPAPGFDFVEDELPAGRGPLAGIAAAFRVTGKSDLLVLACDYPNVGSHLLDAVATAAAPEDDLVMLTDPRGRDHPLVALWRRAAEPVVKDALHHREHKVQRLMPDLAVRRLGPRELVAFDLDWSLKNANLPGDL